MKVAVIQGGPSTEAEVSRASAASVARALVLRGYNCERFELDANLSLQLIDWGPDVVFPAVHGAQGEDGCLQGLLEILALPYVGCDVRASAVAADKLATKLFFRSAGLPVAGERRLTAEALKGDFSKLLSSLREELGYDLVVKPVQGGSTIGISRVFSTASPEEFEAALRSALKHDEVAMVESYLSGQELTCAVLEDDEGPRALPVVLIQDQANGWYDFESKYAAGGSAHVCPAPLSKVDSRRIQEAAVRAHVVLGARDLSRTDFILTKDLGPFLLELNTLPGMTDVSLFPDAARASGMSFERLIEHLVKRAYTRGVRRRAEGERLPLARPLA